MFVTFSQSPSSPEAPTPCPRRYSAISRRPSPKSAKPSHVHIARAVVRTFDRLTRGLETETNVLVVSVTALTRRLLLLTRIPNVRENTIGVSLGGSLAAIAHSNDRSLHLDRRREPPRDRRARETSSNKNYYVPNVHSELLLERLLMLWTRKRDARSSASRFMGSSARLDHPPSHSTTASAPRDVHRLHPSRVLALSLASRIHHRVASIRTCSAAIVLDCV